MADPVIKKIEDLMLTGNQLVPVGGFEFSGYNARLQNKYLEWRKGALELMDMLGPIGVPYRNKIIADPNGGFFYQSAAQLIQNVLREVYDKLKSGAVAVSQTSPSAAVTPPPDSVPAPPPSGGARVIKPPPKSAAQPAQPAPQPASATIAPPPQNEGSALKVFVIGEPHDPIRQELSMFLTEIGLSEIFIPREHGTMLQLDKIADIQEAKFAFFILNADDLAYAMFELGHFVGRLGPGKVCVLHAHDVNVPKNIPGVSMKSIVVKLEEASLGIIKELKGAGLKITI